MTITEKRKDFLLSGDNVNFRKFKEFYEQGRLYIPAVGGRLESYEKEPHDKQVTEREFNTIRMMCKTLEDMHPEAWNLDLVLTREEDILVKGITIYYPELTVKNSSGMEHKMEDFYAHIPIFIVRNSPLDGSISLGRVHGCKTTYTNIEVYRSYMHSHVSFGPEPRNFERSLRQASPSNPLNNFYPFCEGDGLILSAREQFMRSQSEEDFIRFILHVARLVSWESIEGGPHKLMHDIVMQTRNMADSSTPNSPVVSDLITAVGQVHLRSMVHILLNLHYLNNKDFYIKYEVVKNIFGIEEYVIQNEEAIFSALVETYKRIVKESDSFEVMITHPVEEGSVAYQVELDFRTISSYFMYSITPPNSSQKINQAIDIRRLFIPENSEGPTEPFTYEEFSNTMVVFRGKEIKLKRKNLNPPSDQLSRLDLDLVEDLRVRKAYRDQIISIIKQKIIKNVKTIRNARTESSGETVS